MAVAQRIGLVVAREHRPRQGDVLFDERLHAVVQHGHGDLRRAAPHRTSAAAAATPSRSDHALRDVHGLVADALEVGVHLDDRTHQPQVGRDRILQREELDAQVVDLELELVDRGIAGGHLDRQIGLALEQGRHRVAHA